ncbi:MAG: homoserine kinase, partial [Caulobacteraceae bacterium]
MAVYTDITDAELESLLARFDVGPAISFKGIAEGVENSNFLLETASARFILTVFERRVEEADLPFFLGLMAWLAGKGYPCASPIPDRNGEVLGRVHGKPAALIGFLPGLAIRRPSAAHCREAGRGLAALHLAARGFPIRRKNNLGQKTWAGLFAMLESDCERLKSGLAATIADDLATLGADWPSRLPKGVIHGDWFCDNVFFTAGAFAGAIDFYFACEEALAYDVAIALNAWCFEPDGSFNLTNARSLIAGYQSERPLTTGEKDALPI